MFENLKRTLNATVGSIEPDSDLAPLRELRAALATEFGTAETGELLARIRAERQTLAALREDRSLLETHLGTAEPLALTARIQGMETRIAELEAAASSRETATDDERAAPALDASASPRLVVSRVREFTGRIHDLNGTVNSMEEQLLALYEEKEMLEREIGAADYDGIVRVIRDLQTTIGSMESQLMAMYAARERLEVELGHSDVDRIIAAYRNIESLTRLIQSEVVGAPIAPSPPTPSREIDLSGLPRIAPPGERPKTSRIAG